MLEKIYCPLCQQRLIRLECVNRITGEIGFDPGVYEYWCDKCDLDICITNNKEQEKENEK